VEAKKVLWHGRFLSSAVRLLGHGHGARGVLLPCGGFGPPILRGPCLVTSGSPTIHGSDLIQPRWLSRFFLSSPSNLPRAAMNLGNQGLIPQKRPLFASSTSARPWLVPGVLAYL